MIGRGASPRDRGQAALCLKSGFPEAAALRASFAARLDAVIGANAAMLRDSLAGRTCPMSAPPAKAPFPCGMRGSRCSGTKDMASRIG